MAVSAATFSALICLICVCIVEPITDGQSSPPRVGKPSPHSDCGISRAVEDIVKVGTGVIACHEIVQESQVAVDAVDAAALAQHAAVGLVAGYEGTLHVHRAVEGIDPPAQC